MRILHMLHTLDVEPGDLGATVRKGFKWADALYEDLALCVCAHRQTDTYTCPPQDIVGHAHVIEIWKGRFTSVPARYLEYEHENRSRQYSGLLNSMRKAYGSEFDELDEVTVVLYKRID